MILKKFDKTKLILIIVPVIIFAFLAISIYAGYSTNFETWVYNGSVYHMNDTLNKIIIAITNFGGPITISIFCLLLLAYSKTRKKVGIPVSIAIVVSEILNIILKNIFARQRPNILQLVNETSYSFPSGHSMINATIYSMLAILAIKYIKNKKIKISVVILCCLMPLLIGFTRIYLGVHYVTDVIGGLLLGFAVSVIVYTLLKKDNTEFVS